MGVPGALGVDRYVLSSAGGLQPLQPYELRARREKLAPLPGSTLVITNWPALPAM